MGSRITNNEKNITLATALVDRVSESGDFEAMQDAFDIIRAIETHRATRVIGSGGDESNLIYVPEQFNTAHALSKRLRNYVARIGKEKNSGACYDMYKRLLLFEAPHFLDEAILYAEINRAPERKFYEPRRKQLLPIVRQMQRLEEREIRMLLVMMPPGVGKTTLEIFFQRWSGGRHPELSILMGSHSTSLLAGVYNEMIRTCEAKSEYLWNEIFPQSPLVNTNAKDLQIDLQTKKRFCTFQYGSVGSNLSGRFRASNLLCVDDIVDGIETAMSIDRLNKLWQQYTTDYRQRKIGDCAELIVATPWSLHDVIDRLEDMHRNDPQAAVVRCPAMDENDESNFDYPYGLGFTTQFYREQRDVMDEASWNSLYMMRPVERTAILYSNDELRRYFALPDREPDAILAVADTKNKGDDYFVVPLAYQYGSDFYIDKFICDNGKPEVVDERVASFLTENSVQAAQFESNNAGGRIAESIQKMIKDRGGRCQITTKWVQTNKDTRIVVSSAWVKKHCLFKDESLYTHDKEYRTAMNFLTSYSMLGGKANKHDDVPDAMAALYDFVYRFSSSNIEIMRRPF